MTGVSVQDRYDQFQDQAVSLILADFTRKPQGRFLLVIPTGGGKTFTAVKAINRVFETAVLDPAVDRVLWTAHRRELLVQAQDTFKRFQTLYPQKSCFYNQIDFEMIGAAANTLASNTKIRLVVIDEAHHAALKNINYGPIFSNSQLGILGLTATPSRHDGDPLDFERESFSIGFPDLVKKGIVLKPEVRTVYGGEFHITNIDDQSSLEQLNNNARNSTIIAELLNHIDDYKKVIIYVGTVNHVKSLYEQLLKSPLADKYDSISYITGSSNSRDQDRSQFIEYEKTLERSILVNVSVLSEGYDDPSVNTVVMATPTQSKLYYMQAMGRAIRHDPAQPLKKAFIVEVEDKLPNIQYWINNRWLFADVSDALEPAVVDRTYGSKEEFSNAFTAVYEEFHVPADQRTIPEYDEDNRYTMLLFKRYLAPEQYAHFPLPITNDNRLGASNLFNFLSERMAKFRSSGIVSEAALRMVGNTTDLLLPDERKRRWVFDAMTCAVPKELLNAPDEHAESGYPWITFVAFHYCQPNIPEEIRQFSEEMVNRNDVLEVIKARDFEKGSYLLRLPLPLKSFIGKFVTASEFDSLDAIIQQIRALRVTKGDCDHRAALHQLLSESIIPIELVHKDSLIFIARTDEPYSLKLM